MADALQNSQWSARQRTAAHNDAFHRCKNYVEQVRALPQRLLATPPADSVDGVQLREGSGIMDIVRFLPEKQQTAAKRILVYLGGISKIDVAGNMEFVVNGIPLSGSNVVDLLKWATANQDPRGEEPRGLKDFLTFFVTLMCPRVLFPIAKDSYADDGKCHAYSQFRQKFFQTAWSRQNQLEVVLIKDFVHWQ